MTLTSAQEQALEKTKQQVTEALSALERFYDTEPILNANEKQLLTNVRKLLNSSIDILNRIK